MEGNVQAWNEQFVKCPTDYVLDKLSIILYDLILALLLP